VTHKYWLVYFTDESTPSSQVYATCCVWTSNEPVFWILDNLATVPAHIKSPFTSGVSLFLINSLSTLCKPSSPRWRYGSKHELFLTCCYELNFFVYPFLYSPSPSHLFPIFSISSSFTSSPLPITFYLSQNSLLNFHPCPGKLGEVCSWFRTLEETPFMDAFVHYIFIRSHPCYCKQWWTSVVPFPPLYATTG